MGGGDGTGAFGWRGRRSGSGGWAPGPRTKLALHSFSTSTSSSTTFSSTFLSSYCPEMAFFACSPGVVAAAKLHISNFLSRFFSTPRPFFFWFLDFMPVLWRPQTGSSPSRGKSACLKKGGEKSEKKVDWQTVDRWWCPCLSR